MDSALRQMLAAGSSAVQATQASLFSGDELERDSWNSVAAHHERLDSASLDGASNAERGLAEAFSQLAQVALAEEFAVAQQRADAMPDDAVWAKRTRALALAIASQQRCQQQGQDPSAHQLHADRLYQLLRYAADKDQAIAGLHRIVAAYQTAADIALSKEEPGESLMALGMQIAFSNILAQHHDVSDYLLTAAHHGREALNRHQPPKPEFASNLLVLCNNLTTTYRQLAKHEPGAAAHLLENLQQTADFARQSLAVLPDTGVETEAQMVEECLRALVVARVNFAVNNPDAFPLHAESVWQTLQEYCQLGQRFDDGDIRLRCSRFQRHAYAELQKANAQWRPAGVTDFDLYLPDVSQLVQAVQQAVADANVLSQQITQQANLEEQRVLVEAALGNRFVEIADALPAIVNEIGWNFHVCKLLMALGAIASLRFGEIIESQALLAWLLDNRVPEQTKGQQREIQQRQKMPPLETFPEQIKTVSALMGVAALVSQLQQGAQLADYLQARLREHICRLLQQLWADNKTQLLDMPRHSAEDLADLSKQLPAAAKDAAEAAYQQHAN